MSVNGRVIVELGTKIDPAGDDVRVDGRLVKRIDALRYLLLNKPRGVVSTRSDPQRRPTVVDVLARAGIAGYVYPVGRLDYDTEGLLLLTNDGAFAEIVAHPRHALERTYEARVEGVPDDRDLERLRKGLVIDGQRTRPADVNLQRVVRTRGGEQAILHITIREGRNRQVRRMCDAVAHPVDRLRRIRIGPLADRSLKPGQVRDLTPAERQAVLAAATPAPRRRTARRSRTI